MTTRERLVNLLVCGAFGFLGGLLGNVRLSSSAAAAQQTATVIRAESFEVVNKEGDVVGAFQQDSDTHGNQAILWLEDGGGSFHTSTKLHSGFLEFFDQNKNPRVNLGVFLNPDTSRQLPMLEIMDAKRKRIWSAQ